MMGMRPPSDDDDEPDVVEFGIAALDARLSEADVTFPTDARSLANRHGHVEIPFDAAGHSVTLENALADAETSEFDDQRELMNALHPVFEAKRAATRNSLLAQFRALLPF